VRHLALLAILLLAGGCASLPAATPNPATITLDPDSARRHPYFTHVQEKIKAKWVYPRWAGEKGDLLIAFHIAKDGKLALVEVRRSSGIPALDEAALTAVRQARPFSPVPDEVTKQTLAIDGTFRYRIEKK
jgi:protein TonB